MISSRSTPRVIGTWFTIMAVIVSVACVREDVQLAPGVQPQQTWTTPLPEGVSSDPATFRQGLIGIKPLGVLHVRTRAATCNRCTVEVSIQAIADTRAIDPNRPPRTGLAVAHIQNLHPTKIEAFYGFRPRAQADYYLWVDRQPGTDSARMTVLQVPTATAYGTVAAGRQKKLGWCHLHPPGYAAPPDADFAEYKPDCAAPLATERMRIGEASMFSGGVFGKMLGRIAAMLAPLPIYSRDAWIDCNSGCCT
jgi:hypothetical protein